MSDAGGACGAGVTALVLCGGTSARLAAAGIADKTAARVGERPILDHLLNGLPDSWPVVCVGARRPMQDRTPYPVQWTREEPPGGGPVAGIVAGLALVSTPITVVLAGDQPFAADAARLLAEALAATQPGHAGARTETQPSGDLPEGADVDAVCALDASGRPQLLLAAYRTVALRAALPAPENARDIAVHRTLSGLRRRDLPVPADLTLDVDTPVDLATARARIDP